jgi:site-specific DNA recombinase
LDAQEARLRAYCEMRGLVIVDVIRDEGVSAFKHLDKRPGGARLLQLIAKGEAVNVVALKLDRLFRNAADALALTEKWNRTGVDLHLVDLGGAAIDTASATGRMMLTLMSGMAEFERALISERTSTALLYKRSKREAYAPTPLGYRREGKALLPDESELATVARIQALSASGHSLGLPEHGYVRRATLLPASADPGGVSMPGVHRVASLLKRWILGTHQGAVAPAHLQSRRTCWSSSRSREWTRCRRR